MPCINSVPEIGGSLGIFEFGPDFRGNFLKKEIATHSNVLAWRIPWTRGAWWATVSGVAKSWTRLSI